ncbi:hypothetical protein AB0C74_31805 [Spirillospora sp. NPDC048832]
MGPAAMAWAVVYAAFGLACALSRTPLLYRGDTPAPPALGWAVVAVGSLALPACAAAGRYGLRPTLRVWLWAVCGLAVTAAFGLLMDTITLVFGQGVDSAVAAANHGLAAIGALLLAATARSDRRPATASELAPPAAVSVPVPSAASRTTHLAACAGTAAFLPYAVMKLIWASGGTFAGTTGEEIIAISERNGASGLWLTLESWGLDGTALLAALGVLLLWGLVRPWGQVFPRWVPLLHGRRVPRWLPLTPALLGAATLAPYGVVGIGYLTLATAGIVTVPRGDFHTTGDALLVGCIGMVAFAVYGVALTVTARSYWRRTRPSP